jgi:hypothetical protein
MMGNTHHPPHPLASHPAIRHESSTNDRRNSSWLIENSPRDPRLQTWVGVGAAIEWGWMPPKLPHNLYALYCSCYNVRHGKSFQLPLLPNR